MQEMWDPNARTVRITNVTFLEFHELQNLKISSILWQNRSSLQSLVEGAVVNCHTVPLSRTDGNIYILWQEKFKWLWQKFG